MFRIVPKLPAILLLAVLGVWAWAHWKSHEQYRELKRGTLGPTLPLSTTAQGRWDISRLEMRELPFNPVLIAVGLPPVRANETPSAKVWFRVQPPDAVNLGNARMLDEDGWFAAGNEADWNTFAWLENRRAESIEYRVESSDSTAAGVTTPVLRFYSAVLDEAALVGMFMVDLLAVLVGLPLLMWLGVVLYLRSRGARRGTSALSPAT